MSGLSRRQLLVGAALASLSPRTARAANYPDRPIRVIIPYTAGGVAETVVRLLAPGMEQVLGQRLIIEAKPGAGGNLGTLEVARADPDGYTVLVAAANNFVINQFLMKMPVDPLLALSPVAKLADVPLVLFSNPSVPARTLGDFIAYARANPGKLSYGSPSIGTVNHLFIERLKQITGVDIVHIPFHGSPQATIALLANDIQLFPVGLAAGAGYLRDGKVTALAVATRNRLPMLPDVPTVIEAGFPDATAANWWGMAVPSRTPDAAIDALEPAVRKAAKDSTVIERLTTLGMLVPQETRTQFVANLKIEAEGWVETIKRGNIKLE
jgi:tripartite-type tricarboxylate transporter receptor subunit TctC